MGVADAVSIIKSLALLSHRFCRALEEPAPTTLDMQYKRHSESQANSSIRGVSDPLLLPTVVSLRCDCLASLSLHHT